MGDHTKNKKRYDIKDMRFIARERGGECLSNEYINKRTSLLWRCKEGHEWKATSDNVRRNNTWCPICARKPKFSIEDMKTIAKKNGGDCVSLEYINDRVHLQWCCKEGHKWKASPGLIKNGTWCPYCAGNAKYTIQEMQNIAKERGGECLSDKYINMHTKLKWRCADGHEWEATPDNVKHGSWCPYCARKPRLSIEDMKEIAKKKGGDCVSHKYIDRKTKLIWRCRAGHEWEASPLGIKAGSWCPYCAKVVKPTIEEIQNIARDRGGECLSDKYINSQTKLKWRCREGHEWETKPSHVKKGHWCPYCTNVAKLTIEEMQNIARDRGGECLSDKYFNSHTKLKWRCDDGHEWETSPTHIKSGKWCPYCAGIVKLTIEEMQNIARDRGGECLSDKYINSHTKLKWQCSEDHEWNASPLKIKAGTWCPYCAGTVKSTIEEMQNIARERRGFCLSDKYIDNKTKLKWQCAEGHKWEATSINVKRGTWCPNCAGTVKLTIQEMQNIAQDRNGECISEEYINENSNLIWRCADGHEWKASPSNIKRGTWCPHCSVYVSEKICREMFERIFEKPFPNKKPKWLINPDSGFRMELDGFCNDLNIAFEYQGKHHYQETKYAKDKTLTEHIERDQLKKNICNKNNVILIEIPYYIEYEKLPVFIIEELKKHRIDVPQVSIDVFDYRSFDIYSPSKLEGMQEIAKERGGECLSTSYINNRTSLKWRCSESHEWEAKPDSIKRGTWCPYCAGNVKLTIQKMQNSAIERGGLCLSDKYINSNTKLKWQCADGHEWEASPNNVIRNRSWCPICSRKRKKLKKLK